MHKKNEDFLCKKYKRSHVIKKKLCFKIRPLQVGPHVRKEGFRSTGMIGLLSYPSTCLPNTFSQRVTRQSGVELVSNGAKQANTVERWFDAAKGDQTII